MVCPRRRVGSSAERRNARPANAAARSRIQIPNREDRTLSATAYDRGHEAGYDEALEREDDGAREQDGPMWFSCPVAE